jgi:hypothetical protein
VCDFLFDFDHYAHFLLSPNIQYIGQDKPVLAEASGDVDLHVYSACGPTTCDITDAIYGCSSLSCYMSNTVAWTAVSGVEYLLLVTSGRNADDFELQIVDNDSCDDAFGPITPGVGKFLLGSTSDGATIDTEAPSCGLASSATAPGVWYTIIGDGGAITASTCTGTGFDSQISIFTGSCDQLTCVDGNSNACGLQSLVAIQSIQDETYHVLVHGFGGASGNFALQIITEAPPLIAGDFCATSKILELGVPRAVSLTDATEDADVPRCFSWPDDGLPSIGVWYRIVGTGNTMSIQLDSTVETEFCGSFISVLTGSGCSNLSCVLKKDCIGMCDWESAAEQVYYIFISYFDLCGLPEGALLLTAS